MKNVFVVVSNVDSGDQDTRVDPQCLGSTGRQLIAMLALQFIFVFSDFL